MREGQPSLIATSRNEMRFSPRARGSTLCRAFIGVPFKIHPACAGATQCFNDAWFIAIILPACAGVNPSASNQGHCGRNFPRMREGQPAEQSAQF